MKIHSIVEGQGDEASLPILLRRLQAEASAYDIEFGRPLRRSAADINDKDRFQRSLRLALIQDNCSAILVLFDLDDGCPKEKASELNRWAQEVCGSTPFAVVLAHREYESWFLAALESLRGRCGIVDTATSPTDPEARRGAKEVLQKEMPLNRSYSETIDQPTLTHNFDMIMAYQRSRSFRRMINAFGQLLHALGSPLEQWPPANWLTTEQV